MGAIFMIGLTHYRVGEKSRLVTAAMPDQPMGLLILDETINPLKSAVIKGCRSFRLTAGQYVERHLGLLS